MPAWNRRLLALCALTGVLGGCATGSNPKDPWEGFNRNVYAFNDAADRYAIKPVAEGYKAVTPTPVRVGVSNFFSNISDVLVSVNNLLQGKAGDALSDAGRVVVNTTLGIAGLFDVASELGLEKHDEDFGQTLGVWGVDAGPYLVLPLIGPRTVRDSASLVVDWVVGPYDAIDDVAVRNSLLGLNLINTRAQLLGAEKTLDEAAIDPYSFARDFYLRRRESLIYDGNPPREDFLDEVE